MKTHGPDYVMYLPNEVLLNEMELSAIKSGWNERFDTELMMISNTIRLEKMNKRIAKKIGYIGR